MGIRRSLAKWICPELERDAVRFWVLFGRVDECSRWLAEFKDVSVTLQWITAQLRRSSRGAPLPNNVPEWLNAPQHVSEFRDGLRKGLYND